MTTTATQVKWYSARNAIVVVAVTAAAVALIAISQRLGTDSVESVSTTDSGTNGLVEAFNSGKFDAGLNPAAPLSSVSSNPAPVTVSIAGTGGLYEALIAGKFATDFGPQSQYVLGTEGGASSGLAKALNEGKFNEDWPAEVSTVHSSPATRTLTVSGGHQE